MLFAFIIWTIVGLCIIALGIFALSAKKPVGFWANAETKEVNDVKGYNRATGTLFIIYGLVFILLGLPLLSENKAFILLLIVGIAIETIVIMAVYSVRISNKFGVKH